MSEYEYTDKDGRKLSMLDRPSHIQVCAITPSGNGAGVFIRKADAPTVAAELLKAAGQESAIVAKSKSEVIERPFGQIHCGKVTVHADVDYASLLATAADYIAIAEWAKGKLAEAQNNADKEAEAEKKLQERRGAVLAALLPEAAKANNLPEPHELSTLCDRAIDRIIALEDGK